MIVTLSTLSMPYYTNQKQQNQLEVNFYICLYAKNQLEPSLFS